MLAYDATTILHQYQLASESINYLCSISTSNVRVSSHLPILAMSIIWLFPMLAVAHGRP